MGSAADADTLIAPLVELVQGGVPVLRATALELARLERNADSVSGAALATAILRDPLMTLRVLRFLHSHRTRSQTQDITTIAHAIMMLGQARFFREFNDLPSVEDALGGAASAFERVRAAMSRARLAALFARDWAVQRHDMDPDEVMVAALMHDVVELLAWLRWPLTPPTLTPEASAEIHTQLFERLGLPGLISELTDDAQTGRPRVVNVRLACQLARHASVSWQHPELAADLDAIQRLLHVSAVEIWGRVRRVTLQAAREWRFYDVLPAATYLLLLPDEGASALPSDVGGRPQNIPA